MGLLSDHFAEFKSPFSRARLEEIDTTSERFCPKVPNRVGSGLNWGMIPGIEFELGSLETQPSQMSCRNTSTDGPLIIRVPGLVVSLLTPREQLLKVLCRGVGKHVCGSITLSAAYVGRLVDAVLYKSGNPVRPAIRSKLKAAVAVTELGKKLL
jgi:hypothetical protein